jgi:drug/metabolite transporter (DMT)-like permease
MFEFWNKTGLLLFIIGITGITGEYPDGIKWISGCVLIIGIFLNLMPSQYYQKNKEKGGEKNEK